MGEDERRLFRDMLGDVTELKHGRVALRKPPTPPQPLQSRRDDALVVSSLLSDTPAMAEFETGNELVFARAGLQRSVLRRLRRGEFVVEAELDLHGATTPEARAALIDFLREATHRGLRCVRVVHGKGLGSPGKEPVLKRKTDHWLRRFDAVLAFCSARPADGGTGAVYVLLKRKPVR